MATDGLKQRLVGGATLLMVAVIAWFWLLSADSPVDPVSRESQIPAAPDIQPYAVQEPSAPQNIEPIGSERESAPALQSDVVPTPAPQQAPKPAQQPKVTAPAIAAAVKTSAKIADSEGAANAAAKAAAQKAAPKPQPSAVAQNHSAQINLPQTGSPQSGANKAIPAKTTSATPSASTAAPATKSEPKTGKDSKLVAETFQLDQHGLPIAWVVQVGLFSTQASADKIKATLQEKGFKAYTEPFKSDKASGIKVFVGPKLSRERADAQKKAIDQLLKTNTMVVRFAAD